MSEKPESLSETRSSLLEDPRERPEPLVESARLIAVNCNGTDRVLIVEQPDGCPSSRVVEEALEVKRQWANFAESSPKEILPLVAVLGTGFDLHESAQLHAHGVFFFDRAADLGGTCASAESLAAHFRDVLADDAADAWLSSPTAVPLTKDEPQFPPPMPEEERRALMEYFSENWVPL
jgi:hypothetical protein